MTLPQRKVRYYEAVSRLRTDDGDIIPAVDFVDVAESVGLMPKIDNLAVFRCVQVMRRLLLKSRDVGLFCNLSAATLNDPVMFQQFLDFMDANRVLAGSLVFEFTQEAYRNFGPIEHECLAALAERGFRFSMDHVTDLHMSPNELAEPLVPLPESAGQAAAQQSRRRAQRHRSGRSRRSAGALGHRPDRRADRDRNDGRRLLDYDVRFGQGFLFSPPRPVRAEALHGLAADAAKPGVDESPGALLAAS